MWSNIHKRLSTKKTKPTAVRGIIKEHIKGHGRCGMPPLKESYLEQIFLNTLNRLILQRDDIIGIVVKSYLAYINERAALALKIGGYDA